MSGHSQPSRQRPPSVVGRPPSPGPLARSFGYASPAQTAWTAPRTVYSHLGGSSGTPVTRGVAVDEFGRRLSWYSQPVLHDQQFELYQQQSHERHHRPVLPPIQTTSLERPQGVHARLPSLFHSSAPGLPPSSYPHPSRSSLQPPPLPRRYSSGTTMQHSPAPGRRRSTDHGVHHHQPPQQHHSPPALSGLPTVTVDGGRRPKTPPDCCAVCGVTETPEWRKGPAGNRSLCNGCGLVGAKRAKEREHVGVPPPTGFEEIERELEGIGIERFKPPSGHYNLPRGTQQRIRDTQARTRAPGSSTSSTQKTGRPPSRSTKGEKDAAGALVGLRRASVSAGTASQYASAMAPRSPPSSTRGRRSGSLVGEAGSSRPHYKLPALPLSSAYMSPPGGLGSSSPFSHGHLPTPSSSTSGLSARPPSPLRAASPVLAMPSPIRISPLTSARPATPLSSSTIRTFGAPRAPSPSPSTRPMSALTASANRMSIAHLTSPTQRAPTPPRFEVQREAPAVSLATPTSALRRRSSSIAGVPCPRPPTATVMATAQDKPPMVERTTA